MIAFHRFLIGTAIAFCAGFSVWSFVSYRAEGSVVALVLAVSFAVATALLTYYLAHLKRFLGQ